MRKLLLSTLLLAGATLLPAAKNLEVYCIDVEGGKATLWVSPSGESMLVDTGWPGFNRRDASRILAAAKAAGVKKIDYLLITHYHRDHVGGVPQLAEKIPIRNFVDHGPSSEHGQDEDVLFNAYSAFRDKGQHILAKVGDALPIKGMEVRFVSSDGNVLAAPLPGAGQPNPACAGFPRPDPVVVQPENPHSVGTLITFGSLRFLDMGDLTADKEYDLACPVNKIGVVDVFMVSHHGSNLSDSLPFVRAIHPQVALMNNGARKGGDAEVWQRIHDIPGLEDFWQLHFAIAGGKDRNSPDTFIANVDEACEGQWLKLTARPDGTYTIYNSRNKYHQDYKRR
jgi:beta-lactamase superfamily II metal-dependent hydrolase